MKILVVCLGNICRSPLAEGLFRREIESRNLDWEVASGGTANYHVGKRPDPRSQAVARAHGIDITGQRSHHVTAEDIEAFDLVLGLDRQNVTDLRERAETKAQQGKVHLLLEYAGLVDQEGPDVFDPYYDDDAYQPVYEQVERAVGCVMARLAGR